MTPTQRLLCQLARIDLSDEQRRLAGQLQRDVDWEELLSLSRRGGLIGLVARHVVDLEVPKKILHRFVAAALLNRHKNTILMEQAQSLCCRAEARGLVLIPLKGAALNMGLPYNDLSLREMCDLDLLVPPGQLEGVERLLEEQGYVETSDRGYHLRHLHHLTYMREVGDQHVMVELHWTPLYAIWSSPRQEAAMIERSRVLRCGGAGIRALDTEDMLLTVILHLAAHRYRAQLKWLVDIAELARCQPVAWDRVWRRAKKLGAYRAVYFACHLAGQLLEAPIPLPARAPLLHSLMIAASSVESLVTSQEQPEMTRRALINLLQFDSPLGGLGYLAHKGTELLERRWGLRVPRLVSPR